METQILRHFCWSFVWRYINTVFVYNLPRLLTSNFDRSQKRKYLYAKKKARSRQNSIETITDAHFADDLLLLTNTPAQAELLLHSQEQPAKGIGLYVNANKSEYMCFKRKGATSTLSVRPLKLVHQSTSFDSNISLTEWTAINRLSIIWKSDKSNKIKRDFF